MGKKCVDCDGKGVIPDFGPLGLDFLGSKECPVCAGSGIIRVTVAKSVKPAKDKPKPLD